jgi:hypothetical protein
MGKLIKCVSRMRDSPSRCHVPHENERYTILILVEELESDQWQIHCEIQIGRTPRAEPSQLCYELTREGVNNVKFIVREDNKDRRCMSR